MKKRGPSFPHSLLKQQEDKGLLAASWGLVEGHDGKLQGTGACPEEIHSL